MENRVSELGQEIYISRVRQDRMKNRRYERPAMVIDQAEVNGKGFLPVRTRVTRLTIDKGINDQQLTGSQKERMLK